MAGSDFFPVQETMKVARRRRERLLRELAARMEILVGGGSLRLM
jgi:hypothetical protein